jgi:hypothetical protein
LTLPVKSDKLPPTRVEQGLEMTENPIIAEEYQNKTGVPWELGVFDIEKGMIRRFIQAVDDTDPRWQTEAPPTFILTLGGEQFGQELTNIFGDGLLHGSTELEHHQPVRPGDRITVAISIASIRERSQMAFVTFEITYTDQNGQLMAKCQQMMVGYRTEKSG